ncbi:MAG: response regulator [Candidatus Desulfatibia sp.]|uniref:response regulator n=1 Tax=Candidatus Desulfatibia sp. TaxID=3101189 RepID=UPI002F2CB27E
MSNSEMIAIKDVVNIFKLSIETIRKYKDLGFFEPCKRVGRKDFYYRQEILRRMDMIQYYKQKGMKLSDIKKKINELQEQKSFEDTLENADAKKILIIEDETGLIQILKEFLMTGFPNNVLKIFDANEGHKGIELAISIKPDLIILDIALPTISGIEVYKKLARHPNTRHSKFIFFSAQVRYEPKNTIFLPKPISMKTFLEKVQSIKCGLEIPTQIMESLQENFGNEGS